MRIVILGATGYLGKKVVNKLLSEGHCLLCVNRSSSNITEFKPINGQISFCNIEQLEDIALEASSFDIMINMACKYPRNSKSDSEVFEANYYNPLKVFLFSLSHNVRRFITIGTGLPDHFNSYSFSKFCFSETMKWYGNCYHEKKDPLKICNIKLENFYGEDEPKDRFIPNTVEKMKKNEKILLTEGKQVRDFIYIDDVVKAILKLISSKELPEYADIPLGSGEGVSIRTLIEYLKDILQSESELCFGAIPSRPNEPDSIADSEIMHRYGITAQYHWTDGMKKFI